MPDPLINLCHHGARGWTWAIHHPGRVTVWRTDETGRGLHQLVPTGERDPGGRPEYTWVVRQEQFALPAARVAALAQLRDADHYTASRHASSDPPAPAGGIRAMVLL